MEKFLRKWIRKLHRWLVIPFVVFLLAAIFARGTEIGNTAQRFQQVLMMILALTGAYLYLLPYLTKWKRKKAAKEE
jgi:cytochrome bd-type quinol oxidase subunit 2